MDYSHGDWDPDRMVDHARSLQEVARYLKPDLESDESGGCLFSGRVIAPPILLALATEIALKALQCREREGAPDRTHDLLNLFDALTTQTQAWLEAHFPREPIFYDESQFPPVIAGMRETLEHHRSAFLNWRYLHETIRADFCTPVIDQALTVIIKGYAAVRAECLSDSRNHSYQPASVRGSG